MNAEALNLPLESAHMYEAGDPATTKVDVTPKVVEWYESTGGGKHELLSGTYEDWDIWRRQKAAEIFGVTPDAEQH